MPVPLRNFFPNIQIKPPLEQLEAISSSSLLPGKKYQTPLPYPNSFQEIVKRYDEPKSGPGLSRKNRIHFTLPPWCCLLLSGRKQLKTPKFRGNFCLWVSDRDNARFNWSLLGSCSLSFPVSFLAWQVLQGEQALVTSQAPGMHTCKSVILCHQAELWIRL